MTPARLVIDASVLGAAFFNEAGSDRARAFLKAAPPLIAPDLLTLEIASIAAKKVWRQEASVEVGRKAVAMIGDFVERLISADSLAGRAYSLAAQHRFSAYDAAYLALAENEACQLVTLDDKLVQRAVAAGLGALIQPLDG